MFRISFFCLRADVPQSFKLENKSERRCAADRLSGSNRKSENQLARLERASVKNDRSLLIILRGIGHLVTKGHSKRVHFLSDFYVFSFSLK